jgi:type II secretory pathway pseudopilin PulG
MLRRLRAEEGMGLVELLVAMLVLTIALLALLAGYGSAFTSLRLASQKTTASELANSQMELYRALPFGSVGLNDATINDIGDDSSSDYNALYSEDSALDGVVDTNGVQAPSGTVNDVTITSCDDLPTGFASGTICCPGTNPPPSGSSPLPSASCSPVQTVTGNDHHSYQIESYIVDTQALSTTTGVSWTERVVTVVIRNPEAAGDPELLRISSAFDRLPAA